MAKTKVGRKDENGNRRYAPHSLSDTRIRRLNPAERAIYERETAAYIERNGALQDQLLQQSVVNVERATRARAAEEARLAEKAIFDATPEGQAAIANEIEEAATRKRELEEAKAEKEAYEKQCALERAQIKEAAETKRQKELAKYNEEIALKRAIRRRNGIAKRAEEEVLRQEQVARKNAAAALLQAELAVTPAAGKKHDEVSGNESETNDHDSLFGDDDSLFGTDNDNAAQPGDAAVQLVEIDAVRDGPEAVSGNNVQTNGLGSPATDNNSEAGQDNGRVVKTTEGVVLSRETLEPTVAQDWAVIAPETMNAVISETAPDRGQEPASTLGHALGDTEIGTLSTRQGDFQPLMNDAKDNELVLESSQAPTIFQPNAPGLQETVTPDSYTQAQALLTEPDKLATGFSEYDEANYGYGKPPSASAPLGSSEIFEFDPFTQNLLDNWTYNQEPNEQLQAVPHNSTLNAVARAPATGTWNPWLLPEGSLLELDDDFADINTNMFFSASNAQQAGTVAQEQGSSLLELFGDLEGTFTGVDERIGNIDPVLTPPGVEPAPENTSKASGVAATPGAGDNGDQLPLPDTGDDFDGLLDPAALAPDLAFDSSDWFPLPGASPQFPFDGQQLGAPSPGLGKVLDSERGQVNPAQTERTRPVPAVDPAIGCANLEPISTGRRTGPDSSPGVAETDYLVPKPDEMDQTDNLAPEHQSICCDTALQATGIGLPSMITERIALHANPGIPSPGAYKAPFPGHGQATSTIQGHMIPTSAAAEGGNTTTLTPNIISISGGHELTLGTEFKPRIAPQCLPPSYYDNLRTSIKELCQEGGVATASKQIDPFQVILMAPYSMNAFFLDTWGPDDHQLRHICHMTCANPALSFAEWSRSTYGPDDTGVEPRDPKYFLSYCRLEEGITQSPWRPISSVTDYKEFVAWASRGGLVNVVCGYKKDAGYLNSIMHKEYKHGEAAAKQQKRKDREYELVEVEQPRKRIRKSRAKGAAPGTIAPSGTKRGTSTGGKRTDPKPRATKHATEANGAKQMNMVNRTNDTQTPAADQIMAQKLPAVSPSPYGNDALVATYNSGQVYMDLTSSP